MAYHVGLNPPNLCSAKKQKQKQPPPPKKKPRLYSTATVKCKALYVRMIALLRRLIDRRENDAG